MGNLFRADDLAATMPAAPDPGLAEGYLRDPDIGLGVSGSKWHAYYLEYLRAALHGGITALGGTPDIDDPDAFADAIDALDWEDRISTLEGYGSGQQGIISHATDTGVVTTPHTRAVVASFGCRSSQTHAANVAAFSSTASGITSGNFVADGCDATASVSANVSCDGCLASGAISANLASNLSIASATRSANVASGNTENATAHSLALGYDAGAAITPNGTNQNLSILLKANGGHGHFAGTISAGGDVDAGTGATVTLDGATGEVYASGGLDMGYGTGTASGGAVTINQVSGLITTEALSAAAGADETITLTSDKFDAGSMVFANVSSYSGAGVPVVRQVTRPGATTAGIVIYNAHASNALNDVATIRFVAFNPA